MKQFIKRLSLRILVLVAVILTVVTASGYAYRNWIGAERIQQPIAFNHRAHVADAQIDCVECHANFSKGAHSGLPDVDVCMTCHSEAVTQSSEEAKLREQFERKQPVIFRKLFHLPRHVYYSHRRHVVLGKLECARCHGEIANTQAPPSRPLVEMTMDFCIDCHTRFKVTNDCKSCHR